MRSSIPLLATALVALAAAASAAPTERFEIDLAGDFARGDITTSTLTLDGRLAPPLKRERLALLPDAQVVWDIATIGDRRLIATGHEGVLYEQRGSGEAKVLKDFDEAGLYTIHVDRKGRLLAAPSPGGRVYTVAEDGKAEEVATTGAGTVWDMLDVEGGILLATGPKAAIVRLGDDMTTSTLVQFPDTLNVLSLAAIPGSTDVLAGLQGPGMVARVAPDGTWRVLVDVEQEEVRRVAVMKDGSFVAAVNGVRSPGERFLQPGGGPTTGGNQKPRPESFLVRVRPSGFVEEWWTSPESPIHDIAVQPDGRILVAAGERGNLFEVSPTGETEMRGVTDEKHLTRLAPAGDGSILVGTAAEAALLKVTPGASGPGIYESEVLDAKGSTRWSRVRGVVAAGDGAVRIATRSGNTAKPGDAWSAWSAAEDFSAGEHIIRSPMGRFLQFRIELDPPAAPRGEVPTVDVVRVFHVRENVAPTIRELNVQVAGAVSAAPPPQASPRPGGVPPRPGPGGPGGDPRGGGGNQQGGGAGDITISWNAADPNNDELRYAVFLRPVAADRWLLVKEDLAENRLVLPAREVPDGEYRVRVVASDRLGNEPGAALEASRESNPFVVDYNPPAVIVLSVQRQDSDKVAIRVRIEDSVSLLASARWRSGFGNWSPLVPEDGALDQRSETFAFVVDDKAGLDRNDLVTVVATDEAGNTVVARIPLD